MSSEVTQEYQNEEEWWLEEGYSNPDDVPAPDWHLAILKEREANSRQNKKQVIKEIKRRKK
jgi:hypothetical protein